MISEKVSEYIAKFCLIILVLRIVMSSVFGIDTFSLTIVLNMLLLFAIGITGHLAKKFSFLLCMFPIAIYNREILATIDVMLFVYLFRKTSIRDLAIYIFFIMFVAFCLVYVCGLIGIIDLHKPLYYTHRVEASYAFGFSNSNTFGVFIFSLLSCFYIVLRKYPKVLFVYVVFLVYLSFVLYNYTQSRGIMVGLLMLSFIHIFQSFHLIRHWMRYVIAVLPMILFLVNVYWTLFYVPDDIANLSTSRLRIYREVVYSMTPLNWMIGTHLPSDEPMDGSFWMLIFGGGIFWAMFFYYNFYKSSVCCFDKIVVYLPIIIATVAYGIAENIFWSCNGLSIIFWMLVFSYYMEKSESENSMLETNARCL